MPSTERETRLYHQAQSAGAIRPYDDTAQDEAEIDLVELFYFLLAKLRWIILVALLGAVLAGVYTFFVQTPMYEATAKLYVTNTRDSAINLSDLQIGTYLTKDYQEVFSTWEVHEMVVRNLGLNYTYKQLQSKLSVSNPKDTRILHITIKSPSPSEASILANEYAAVAKKYIFDIMSTEEPNILSVALQPTVPVSPNKSRTVMLGFILGGLLMAGLFVVRFIMDDKVKTPDDIAKYSGLVTLAVIPSMKLDRAAKPPGTAAKGQSMPVGQTRGRK